jgi:D-tyrosyl-tRNA(Tyr) deacylase
VVQRVIRASVAVNGRKTGEIGRGLLVLLGVSRSDDARSADWMAEKIVGLRIFADEEGKFDRSVGDIGGELLIVSQFTLYGDTRKGRRPSFAAAEEPARAEPLYERVVERVRALGIATRQGVFGAHMEVELVNDGPVTLLVESAGAERAPA